MAIPVTIITGFLGAGKTTFLNALLAHLSTQKLAIIENEFGKENIDSELIIGNEEEVMPLTQGCICCTLNEDFYLLLHDLHKRETELDGLVIETTGIADPSGILSPFLVTPALREAFPVARVICLVDASLINQQLQETEEAITQISYSNHILLVKTDVVSPALVKELQQMLAEINPTAHIWVGQKGVYPLKEILEKGNVFSLPEPFLENKPSEKKHGKITSLTFAFTTPFDPSVLHYRLAAFLAFQAKGVYRMKGILAVQDKEKQVILQSVGTQLVWEDGRDWQKEEPRNSRIVLIGRDLKREGYERLFKQCLAKI